MQTGTVKWFNQEKGYGFITKSDGEDIFVHISDIAEGIELVPKMKVTYELGMSNKGPKAVNVKAA